MSFQKHGYLSAAAWAPRAVRLSGDLEVRGIGFGLRVSLVVIGVILGFRVLGLGGVEGLVYI